MHKLAYFNRFQPLKMDLFLQLPGTWEKYNAMLISSSKF